MGLSRSMKPDEDSRTGFLCVLMAEKGYQVKDQTRWGQSGTGLSMGRLDAVIKTPDGREVILEAFKLTTYDAAKIESHCRKIFQYDPLGLENNFMVVYCDCPGKDFVGHWEKYREKVREIDYPYPIHTLEERTTPYPAMRAARAIHHRHQKEVGIYHLFLHMQ
jgi:hypothetical protein